MHLNCYQLKPSDAYIYRLFRLRIKEEKFYHKLLSWTVGLAKTFLSVLLKHFLLISQPRHIVGAQTNISMRWFF